MPFLIYPAWQVMGGAAGALALLLRPHLAEPFSSAITPNSASLLSIHLWFFFFSDEKTTDNPLSRPLFLYRSV